MNSKPQRQKKHFDTDIQDAKSLTNSKNFADAVIRTIKEPFVVLDENLMVIFANRSFYKTFKVFKKDTIGKSIYKLGNKQWNDPRLKKLLEDILPDNNFFEDFEVEYEFPKIGCKTMLLNGRKFIADGEHILLTIENITDRKQVEKEKDEFASLISHELKAPVATISGYSQLLESYFKTQKDLKRLEYTQSIYAQIRKLTNLINGLLNAGKLRARGFEFHNATFDLDSLVVKLIKDVQLTTTHTITIKGACKAKIFGDKEKIGQVIINLLLNGIKYSPNAKEIVVLLSSSKKEIKIGVQDFGIGISKENQNKVFDKFFQLEGSNKETFYGIGLGLDISSQIIAHHHGKIWVDSMEKKGSTFYFTLPRTQQSQK